MITNRFARSLTVAVLGLLLASVPASAQFVPPTSNAGRLSTAYPGMYALPREYQYMDTMIQRRPVADRPLGILFTTINYPGRYGGYTIGVEAASYDIAPSLSWQSYAPRPQPSRPLFINQTPSGMTPATLRVLVPGDAEVFFEDEMVPGDGFVRDLSTVPLVPDRSYLYEVRARWTQDGRTVARKQMVRVRAGDSIVVDLGGSGSATPKEGTSTLRTAPLPLPSRR